MAMTFSEKAARAQKDQKLRLQEQQDDLLAVISTPEGRRFLARLLRDGGFAEYLSENDEALPVRNFLLGIFVEVRALDAGLAREILINTFSLGE